MSENNLTHFDAAGNAVMVDVSEKPVTAREATAHGIITMNADAFAAVESGTVKKGDVLGVARVAGIMATKRTSELIPLCHPLPLTKVQIEFDLLPERRAVEARCTVKTSGVTCARPWIRAWSWARSIWWKRPAARADITSGRRAAMFDSKGRNIHYLRLSVTDLCNLRCRYCMPDGVDKLEREDILTYEEFLRLAALFARCGVDTVRVTGGEPLVRKGVEQLVKGLKAIPGIRKVTMTTNAVLLEQQLPALLEAGLDSVNISLDTLDPALFAKITARDELAAVQAGIHAALESGIPVKLNCVPQVGVNEGELEALAVLAQDKPLQVRFIEMMPIGYGAAMPCISGPELLARFRRCWPELAPLPGAACAALGDGPAVYYTVPGWKGDIGFIAAVHGKFCASCNRVRLTSQGFLRPCLASEAGCDLKALLRSGASDEELLAAIRTTIWEKPQEHHFELKQDIPATRGMYRIGG